MQDGLVDGVRTVVLRQAINPLSLIEQMNRVYVVTSTMGFEALVAGKPVTVFGMPWYAGWGRRMIGKPVYVVLVSARCMSCLLHPIFHYSRYLNPVTHQRGTIFFDVIDWLERQRDMAARYPDRMICVGFSALEGGQYQAAVVAGSETGGVCAQRQGGSSLGAKVWRLSGLLGGGRLRRGCSHWPGRVQRVRCAWKMVLSVRWDWVRI
ncbi:hypothetical protein ACFS07_07420 [Undibacterium arcticum]